MNKITCTIKLFIFDYIEFNWLYYFMKVYSFEYCDIN